MSSPNKVVWSEGLFLRPQHFQQHDRYLENLVSGRTLGLQPFNWGFYSLAIDRDLLKIGKLALTECTGIFPDGTPFSMPKDDETPLPLDLGEDVRDEMIYLAFPVRRPESAETASTRPNSS